MFKFKLCGVTCVSDAKLAVDAGASAVGMICYADAPRCISLETATEIVAAIDTKVQAVMLFVNAPPKTVGKFLKYAPNAWLQFHGTETSDECESFGVPYLKACKPQNTNQINSAIAEYKQAQALILDGGSGTGTSFDWSLVPARKDRTLPIMLAGGLNAQNVVQAIKSTDPEWVDVSSGVCYDDDPLRKDPAKVTAFASALGAINV